MRVSHRKEQKRKGEEGRGAKKIHSSIRTTKNEILRLNRKKKLGFIVVFVCRTKSSVLVQARSGSWMPSPQIRHKNCECYLTPFLQNFRKCEPESHRKTSGFVSERGKRKGWQWCEG